jgi:hypothetical protein
MKNHIITILFVLSFTNSIFSQNEKIEYSGGTANLRYYSENMEFIKENPMGNQVNLKYDGFFKSYDISFIMEEGKGKLHLSYYDTLPDGTLRYQETINFKEKIFLVYEKLQEKGSIVLKQEELQVSEKSGEKFIIFIVINNLTTKS